MRVGDVHKFVDEGLARAPSATMPVAPSALTICFNELSLDERKLLNPPGYDASKAGDGPVSCLNT